MVMKRKRDYPPPVVSSDTKYGGINLARRRRLQLSPKPLETRLQLSIPCFSHCQGMVTELT